LTGNKTNRGKKSDVFPDSIWEKEKNEAGEVRGPSGVGTRQKLVEEQGNCERKDPCERQ